MPWTCQACSIEVSDETTRCPGCERPKTTWTIVASQTRDMVLGGVRAKLECRVGEHGGTLPQSDPGNQGFASAPAEVCPSLAKAELLEVLARGHLPAPAHRLVARLYPRNVKNRDIVLTVDLAEGDPVEHELPQGSAAVNAEGFFEVVFQCVHGPEDVSGVELPGMHLIDLTEASEEGLAPEVEVAALKRRVELPTQAVSGSADAV